MNRMTSRAKAIAPIFDMGGAANAARLLCSVPGLALIIPRVAYACGDGSCAAGLAVDLILGLAAIWLIFSTFMFWCFRKYRMRKRLGLTLLIAFGPLIWLAIVFLVELFQDQFN
ncbi:hypothetical protein [Burkholderia sp. Ac-20349]|uniref:hypothetical protein n=1 Tax=Burkholderia sp. Ac-20349 TaxID=2703893 RepID=UPI00197CA27F|nr:hypothetical protein [Burkholderia sp. Ac-20349]MBN3838878.1 hypothetical protein [Burkholderia sp. Ac-20349]